MIPCPNCWEEIVNILFSLTIILFIFHFLMSLVRKRKETKGYMIIKFLCDTFSRDDNFMLRLHFWIKGHFNRHAKFADLFLVNS
jgi:hypothetical protein